MSKQLTINVGNKPLSTNVFTKDGKEYVCITPICEAIGVAPNRQAARLSRNPQFSPDHMVAPSQGGQQTFICLPIEEVGMWLCSINASKVKSEIRDILIAFQRHCQVELYMALTGQAGLERVRALEEQVFLLASQMQRLLEENLNMRQQVEDLVKRDGDLASIGGKILSVTKSTKAYRIH